MRGSGSVARLAIGAKLPTTGSLPSERGIAEMAVELERVGFESLWVSDHVVMPRAIGSTYPFAPDGRATWATDVPWFDALVALALAAAVTSRARLGTAVLVLPLRHPVIVAKQLASIDAAARGRLTVGVGAGWLREEFDALRIPFDSRGSRLEEWIALLRACWTGYPPALAGEHYELPADVVALPQPAHEIPILIGGHTRPAIRRAATVGDGWLGQQSLDALDLDEIARVRADLDRQRRYGADPRVVLRIVDAAGRPDELAPRLRELADAGVREVIVDVDWNGDPGREFARLVDAW